MVAQPKQVDPLLAKSQELLKGAKEIEKVE